MTASTSHDAGMEVPRPLLWGAAALLALAVTGTAAVRWSGATIRAPDAPAVATIALRFEDRPDGSIAVLDGHSGKALRSITGEAGFVRGTLRGLARERKRMGGGPEQAFELVRRADGRLTLHDPVTGRVVDLDSFGPINSSGFAALLASTAPSTPNLTRTP